MVNLSLFIVTLQSVFIMLFYLDGHFKVAGHNLSLFTLDNRFLITAKRKSYFTLRTVTSNS